MSAILQKKLPPQCKDPGMFTIPCKIGNTRFEHAMLDLGAFINVMPYSIYASLNLGPLEETGVILSVYEKEMMAILAAVKKWNSYLIGRHFKIRTDQLSLKFLLDQRTNTPAQQAWVIKMMGYDYEVVFHKGVSNVVTSG